MTEVTRTQKVRAYQDFRAVALTRQADAGSARHRPSDVLPLDDRYLEGGPEALADRQPAPIRLWNRVASEVQDANVEMALDYNKLSPCELALGFADERQYFVSEATVYRLLIAYDLITSSAYVLVKTTDAFHTKTTRSNEMWQTDFPYFKIIGWRWMYLSTVLDNFSRFIIV